MPDDEATAAPLGEIPRRVLTVLADARALDPPVYALTRRELAQAVGLSEQDLAAALWDLFDRDLAMPKILAAAGGGTEPAVAVTGLGLTALGR